MYLKLVLGVLFNTWKIKEVNLRELVKCLGIDVYYEMKEALFFSLFLMLIGRLPPILCK